MHLPESSVGNHTFRLKNKGYTYDYAIIVMGEEDAPPALLTIYKGSTMILSSKAEIL